MGAKTLSVFVSKQEREREKGKDRVLGFKQGDLWFPALFMQTYSIMSAAVQAQTLTVLLLLPLEHLNRITKQFRLIVTLDWTEKPEHTI